MNGDYFILTDSGEGLTRAQSCSRFNFIFTMYLIKPILEKMLNLIHIFIQGPECRHNMKIVADISNALKDCLWTVSGVKISQTLGVLNSPILLLSKESLIL